MIKPVVITTDSCSEISPELAEKYSVGVVPLHVFIDGKEYRDGENVTIDDIYEAYDTKKIIATTSAVVVAEYLDFFKKYTDKGASVVYVSFSSGLSSCYQNACIAAQELKEKGAEVHVIDSRSLSQSMCYLIIKAAELRDEGLSAQEIVPQIEALVPKLNMTFVVNSLEFLKKGGRCSALAAFGANILGIKPRIDLVDGSMGIGKKYRGKLENVHIQYLDEMLASGDFDMQRVFISHTGLSSDRVDLIVKHLRKTTKFKEIIVGTCNCVVCSHGGKDAMAILLLHK
ncbi:MAG: DegV family protein [Clostridia bacterium]|nr:DegV family protein [Clostridia bacterium]